MFFHLKIKSYFYIKESFQSDLKVHWQSRHNLSLKKADKFFCQNYDRRRELKKKNLILNTKTVTNIRFLTK